MGSQIAHFSNKTNENILKFIPNICKSQIFSILLNKSKFV